MTQNVPGKHDLHTSAVPLVVFAVALLVALPKAPFWKSSNVHAWQNVWPVASW